MAVLCVLQSTHGLLLLKRKKPPHQGIYTPIGGKIDPFERPIDTAYREIKEEAGVTVANLRLAGIMTETSPIKYNWMNYIYTTQVDAFDPPPCNEGDLAWVQYDAMHTIDLPETDPIIFDHIKRNQFFAFDATYDDNITLLKLIDEVTNTTLYDHKINQ